MERRTGSHLTVRREPGNDQAEVRFALLDDHQLDAVISRRVAVGGFTPLTHSIFSIISLMRRREALTGSASAPIRS